VFLKARRVPFPLVNKVEAEIDRLLDQKAIYPLKYSKWATPVVVVLKESGAVRLCGDYRSTVNTNLLQDRYP
jgi:hypothetical protein